MSEPLLEVRDLAVSFQGGGARTQAVDGVNLTIYPGQTLAVVGESGSGKSVTAMSLLHLVPRPPARFDRGSAVFQTSEGPRDLLAMSERDIRAIRGNQIAMIFQEPMTSLNPVFTIGEQIIEAVRLHQRARPREAEDIAVEALVAVGIPDPARRLRAYPHQFSGGMRQRVMIAMALACRPRLLLADEPTTALDVTVQAQILALLRSLQRERGMGMMLITHDLGIVARNADAVCVMYAGRVVEYASVADLFAAPLHPYTRGLLASMPRLRAPRGRLITIAESINDPRAFDPIRVDLAGHDGGSSGVRPWWPRSGPVADGVGENAPGYELREVRADHWMGVWQTPELDGLPSRPPRLGVLAGA